MSRTYDNSLRLLTQSVNGGSSITFGYDRDDLLTSAGSLTLTRDDDNGLVTATTLGSIHGSFSPNAFGEVDSHTAKLGTNSPFFSETVTSRDDLGRIVAKTETIGAESNAYLYGYDLAGRLTDVTLNNSAVAHYSYDDNSNRIPNATNPTFNQAAGVLLDAEYDAQDRLLSSEYAAFSTAYTYTANGELASKIVSSSGGDDVTNYVYDFLGNLRRVTLHAGATNEMVIDYLIDGVNRRIGKKMDGALVQGFLYDGQLRIVAELDPSGAVVSRFVYGSKSNVPDYMLQSSTAYRIISDHLGSPRLVINASTGTVRQRLDYDEVGNITFESQYDAGGDPVTLDPVLRFQPFGFASGLRDPQTGLVRFGARDYDPETGRWTTKDPVGFKARGTNLYGYVLQDPINSSDASGLNDTTLSGVEAGIQLGGILSLVKSIAFVSSAAVVGYLASQIRFEPYYCPLLDEFETAQGKYCRYQCAGQPDFFESVPRGSPCPTEAKNPNPPTLH